jgi:hypothetical protein
MTLPVANDGETLDLVSKLCGTYEAERQTLSNDKEGNVSASTVMETRPTFPLEAIRMLPDFTSLVLYGNHRPNEGVDQPVLGAEIGEACRSEGCEACRTVPPRAADGILVSRQNSKDGGEGVALDPLEGPVSSTEVAVVALREFSGGSFRIGGIRQVANHHRDLIA